MRPQIRLKAGQLLTIKDSDGTLIETVVVVDKNEHEERPHVNPCDRCILAQTPFLEICRNLDCLTNNSHLEHQ